MFCFVSRSQAPAEHLDAMVRIYREQSIPQLSRRPGFKAAYYISKPLGEVVELMIVQIWESEEKFFAWLHSPEHDAIVAQITPLQSRPSEREVCQLQAYGIKKD